MLSNYTAMADTTTPKALIAPISSCKTIETYLGEYMPRLMYAACADVETELDAGDKFSPYVFHSYTSMCVEKKNREKLDPRFTIADEAKQMLAHIFNKCIDECLSVVIGNDDTVAMVQERISEVTDDSFFAFAVATPLPTGETLAGACDPGSGLRGFVVGKMPLYVARDRILSMIFTCIDNFLKATALMLIKLWWFQRKPIDGGMLAGLYYTRGLNQYMVADLIGCLRAKPVAKPKAKKAVVAKPDATKPDMDKTVTDASTDTPVTESSDVAVNTAPLVDMDLLDAVLGAV